MADVITYNTWSLGNANDGLPVMIGQLQPQLLEFDKKKYIWNLDDLAYHSSENKPTEVKKQKYIWYRLYDTVAHQLPYTFNGPDGSLLDIIVGYLYISASDKFISVPLYLLSSSKTNLNTYIDGRYYYIPIQEDDGTGAVKIHINSKNYTI